MKLSLFTYAQLLAFILFHMLITHPLEGQNFSSHQWENRVLVIQCRSDQSEKLHQQLLEFETSKQDLVERRLVLYVVIKDKYQFVDFKNERGEKIKLTVDQDIENLKNTNALFQIQLIGLDGGVKLEQKFPLESDELFRIIDSMPMRRSEMRRKG